MTKKTPLRMCIGCGEYKTKKELIRIVKTNKNDICIDKQGKRNGRGAYICNNILCFNNAIKQKAIERSLKVNIPKEIIAALEEEMNNIEP